MAYQQQQQGYPQQQQQQYGQPQPAYGQQTTVVHQQTVVSVAVPPSGYALSFGPQWSSGLCSCFDDVASCCEVVFCGYCQIGYQKFFSQYGRPGMDSTSCCCAMLLDGCLCFGMCYAYCSFQIRQQVSRRYFIVESGIETFFFGCCCPECSLCQTYREMNGRGEFPGGCCVTPAPAMMPPQQAGMVVQGQAAPDAQFQQSGGGGGYPPPPQQDQQPYPHQQQHQQPYPMQQQQQQQPPQHLNSDPHAVQRV